MHRFFKINNNSRVTYIFTTKPTKQSEHQARDLSMNTTVGEERMIKYCQDYVLGNEPLKTTHIYTTAIYN